MINKVNKTQLTNNNVVFKQTEKGDGTNILPMDWVKDTGDRI